MADYSTYELTPDLNVYELADNLLPEIADVADYELSLVPNAENLGAFIAKIGPDKELQQNIGAVREALGSDSVQKIADWIDRSGILVPVERGFMGQTALPEQTDAIIWSGGVANWMLRRASLTQRFNPENVGSVVLPFGNREMKPAEHQLVSTFIRHHGQAPTEYLFAEKFIRPVLQTSGFNGNQLDIMQVEDNNGDNILREMFERRPELLGGTITVVSNAPNTIQAAGQLRLQGRQIDPSFDSRGDQLSMVGDSIPLARKGEAAKTHQNPLTALGQLGRNALFLVKNQPTAA